MTKPICPVCCAADCRVEFQDPQQADIQVQVCRHCGLAFLFPHLSNGENRRFVAESYDYGKAIVIPSVQEKYRRRIVRQADFLARHLPTPGRVLDIGCYQGDLLEEMAKRGWRGYAIESSGQACQVLRQERPHLVCHEGFVEDLPFLGEPFALIIVSRTLNHILQPVAFLSLLGHYADFRTRLYLEVSSLESVLTQPGVESGNYFRPYLPVIFTMSTLVDTLKRAGWGGFVHLDTTMDSEADTVYLRVLTSRSAGARQRTLQESSALLAAYRRRVAAHREKRRQKLKALKSESRPFVTWGAGEQARRLLDEDSPADNPRWLAWIDSQAAKWGARLLQREVLPPSRLQELQPELIVITASPAFAGEIEAAARAQLPDAVGLEVVCLS